MIVLIMAVVVNLALIAWAVTDIMQRRNVKYLPKMGWIIFIAFVFFGSVIYILAGRAED